MGQAHGHGSPARREVRGYELHLATYVPPTGADPIPQLTAGMVLRSGVTRRAPAVVAILDTLGDVDEVLLDRGYTQAKAENLARPLRVRGVEVTMDLHSTQRGVRPGPIPGTIWVDGHLYISAMPEALQNLDEPPMSISQDERKEIRGRFDKREAYRFTALAKHRDDRNSQRFKGPALAGHLRCVNTPASIRLGHHLPTTSCAKGAPCGCGKTVTVPDTDVERDRQPHPWQSTAWVRSYNRRSLIEGLNAQIRFQSLNINRGFIRLNGLASTTLLLAVTLAGRNFDRLHDWHTARGLNDPWQDHLGEPPDDRPLDRYTRTRGKPRRWRQ